MDIALENQEIKIPKSKKTIYLLKIPTLPCMWLY